MLLTSNMTKAVATKLRLSINEEHWSKKMKLVVLADSLKFAELYKGQSGTCVVASLQIEYDIHQTGSKRDLTANQPTLIAHCKTIT